MELDSNNGVNMQQIFFGGIFTSIETSTHKVTKPFQHVDKWQIKIIKPPLS